MARAFFDHPYFGEHWPFTVAWPLEGPGGKRDLALWCARQVEKHADDQSVGHLLALVQKNVNAPGTVSAEDLEAACVPVSAAADRAWQKYKNVHYSAPWATKAYNQHKACWCAVATTWPGWKMAWAYKSTSWLLGRKVVETKAKEYEKGTK